MHGTHQNMGFISVPAHATVSVDGKPLDDTTPVMARLSRNHYHYVKIELEGYKPFEARIGRTVSGWVVGNVFWGGPIGLALDWVTGGMYRLSPGEVKVALAQAGLGALLGEDAIYVVLVRNPNPEWEAVGTLEPSRQD